MRTTKQLSITLPNEMAKILRDRVESGDYASESEVIRDGLRVLFARDAVIDEWLRTRVAKTYDNVTAGKQQTYSSDEIKEMLRRSLTE
ncbi:MAG: type II toxin-antitoxin system ParD family antitoxin [Actinomycetaceae bacterium]|nr:type II toxin-antitoxin system ParD family antitoxin [Actinomycetaceae bacterium]